MKRIRALGLIFLLATLLGSCASVRNGLGTRDAVCFGALPAAQQTVGKGATFAGVKYQSPDSLVVSVDHGAHKKVRPPAEFLAMSRKGACLVAYKGRFPAGVISHAWRPEPGPYAFAVVVVGQSNHHVLGVLLLHRAPLRFGHLA